MLYTVWVMVCKIIYTDNNALFNVLMVYTMETLYCVYGITTIDWNDLTTVNNIDMLLIYGITSININVLVKC